MVSGSSTGTNRWRNALYLPLTVLAWLGVAIVGSWLIGHVLHTVVIMLLGTVVAFALWPMVRLFGRWLPHALAIAAAYVVGLVVVVILGSLLIITTAGQVINLIGGLPSYYRELQTLEQSLVKVLQPLGISQSDLRAINAQIIAQLQHAGATLATGSIGIVRDAAGIVLDAVLVVTLSVYFTLIGPLVATWLTTRTPTRVRRPARQMVRVVCQVFGGYIRGTLTMALLTGFIAGAGLYVLGVPYAVLLGVFAFLMSFIPVLGTMISGAVSILVALPAGGPITAAMVFAFFFVLHIVEGDIIAPRVMGHSVGIHPVLGLVAVLVGTELFGVWGALFASPIAGLLQAVATTVWRELTLSEDQTETRDESMAGR